MRITTSSILSEKHTQVWKLLKQSSTLFFITKGWVTFKNADEFPAQWEEGMVLHTLVQPFGIGSGSPYKILFSAIKEQNHVILTRETGGPFKAWNHTMRVEYVDDHQCRYTDVVDIKAGLLTPLWGLYVMWYYRHRHKRWQILLKDI